MTTIRDVAKACGVSVATVSGVLNNTPDAAGPETRQRVLDMIRRMNYSPSAVARGLSRRRMNTIGVVMEYNGRDSLINDQHLGPIFDGVVATNSRLNRRTLLHTGLWANAMSNIPTYTDRLCDGLLLIVPIVPDEFFAELTRRGTHFVIVGDFRSEPHISAIDLDNVDAGRRITSYLIELGHRRIAMLRGNDSHRSSWLRAQGYREALEQHGVDYDARLDRHGSYDTASGYEQASALLDLPNAARPTALFCGDDRIAAGALEALEQRGLRVPEDVSVVGINDSAEGARGKRPLTTLRQPGSEIGQRALELLTSHIAGDVPAGRKIALPGTLVVRSTTGPASNAD